MEESRNQALAPRPVGLGFSTQRRGGRIGCVRKQEGHANDLPALETIYSRLRAFALKSLTSLNLAVLALVRVLKRLFTPEVPRHGECTNESECSGVGEGLDWTDSPLEPVCRLTIGPPTWRETLLCASAFESLIKRSSERIVPGRPNLSTQNKRKSAVPTRQPPPKGPSRPWRSRSRPRVPAGSATVAGRPWDPGR